MQVSYTYEANGRLQVKARLKGYEKGVAADFERENRLPEEDLQQWANFIEDELLATEE